MIEITKDQCTRMLVWDDDESDAIEEDVYAYFISHVLPFKTITGVDYKHAKPLPEEKPMTALDVIGGIKSKSDKITENLHCKRKEVKEAKRVYDELDIEELYLKSHLDGFNECYKMIEKMFDKPKSKGSEA